MLDQEKLRQQVIEFVNSNQPTDSGEIHHIFNDNFSEKKQVESYLKNLVKQGCIIESNEDLDNPIYLSK